MNLAELVTDPAEREAVAAMRQQCLALAQILHEVPTEAYVEPVFGFDVDH